jgi:cytochrome d ubiquinol oxidase subunit II
LTALYFPVAIMLLGLTLRGVAFDFRVKAKTQHKGMWNTLFFLGSLLASLAQGWMLGRYVMGLSTDLVSMLFAAVIAILLPCLYIMLGSGWLLVKTDGEVYDKALLWARRCIVPLGLGLFVISIATPIASEAIASKWFSLPEAIGLLPIPMTVLIAYGVIIWVLNSPKVLKADYGWIVYAALIVICVMSALGLGYSIFPDIVIGQLDIWESAAARSSLMFAFVGSVIAVPAIFIYTVFIYRIFSGKTKALSYESD